MMRTPGVEPVVFDISTDQLLGAGEIIKRLKISRSTFERWVREGKFPKAPFYLTGTPENPMTLRWPRSMVVDWLVQSQPV